MHPDKGDDPTVQSWSRKIALVVIGWICVLGILEIGARVVYYQLRGPTRFALVKAFQLTRVWAESRIARPLARMAVEDTKKDLPKGWETSIFKAEGKDLLNYYNRLYEEAFAEMASEAQRLGTRVLVLWMSFAFKKPNDWTKNIATFNEELCRKYHVDFLDPTEQLAKYPEDVVTLQPHNAHFSRFGNRVLAESVAPYIRQWSDHRCTVTFGKDRPELLGDLQPFENYVWAFETPLAFRVIRNSQGLRMDHELAFPKHKQHVLCLGASGTFGPYLPNHDTYPGQLADMFPEKEVINGGIVGYTILDSVSLFLERAKYCEPDILVMQVSERDYSEGALLAHKRSLVGRVKHLAPPPEELEYFKKLREKQKK